MRSMSQICLLVFVFLSSLNPVLAEPKVELSFEVNKKVSAVPLSILARIGEMLFGATQTVDRFSVINGVAVDAQDNIYLTDSEKERVVILNKEGKALPRGGEIGRRIFKNPMGIAVDSRGRIYVTDTILNKLFIFDKNGVLLQSLLGDGT